MSASSRKRDLIHFEVNFDYSVRILYFFAANFEHAVRKTKHKRNVVLFKAFCETLEFLRSQF